jgi:hypothetical protein
MVIYFHPTLQAAQKGQPARPQARNNWRRTLFHPPIPEPAKTGSFPQVR